MADSIAHGLNYSGYEKLRASWWPVILMQRPNGSASAASLSADSRSGAEAEREGRSAASAC